MKKFLCGLVVGLLIASSAAVLADGQALLLIVNGVDITDEAQPVLIDGRTLVPARALAEKLGASVAWDSTNNAVVVTTIREQASHYQPEPSNTSVRWPEGITEADKQEIIAEIGSFKELTLDELRLLPDNEKINYVRNRSTYEGKIEETYHKILNERHYREMVEKGYR